MIRTFRSKPLRHVFESGNAGKLPVQNVARVRRILQALMAATKPEDMNLPGSYFHGLEGEARWSVVEVAGNVEDIDPAVLLAAMAATIDGLGAVSRRLFGADRGDGVEQALLVPLDLGDQDVAGVPGRFKGFFDSAWRRR